MNFEVCGFEHLHLHTDFSLLDGYGMVEEYAERWKNFGNYLCISDHGMMAAIPRQIKACEKHGLTPLFAVELYVNPLQIEYDSKDQLDKYIKSLNPDEQKVMRKKGYHLLAIAHNEVGYSNLVHLTSLAWTKGYYYRPRVNHEQLMKYKEGIYFTSCCYASEIAQAFDKGGEDAGFDMIEKYIKMFGADNFFLEIMLLDFEKQKPYDAFICKAHEKYGLSLIVTNDCHYCKKEDSIMQRNMLMIQTGTTIMEYQKKIQESPDADLFVDQDKNLWQKSERELDEKWLSDYKDIIDYELYKQAKRNTVEICRRAEGINIDRSIKLPKFTYANERLKDEAIRGFKLRGCPNNEVYKSRLKEELELIKHKDFASYFLIVKMITDEARRVCPTLLGWGSGAEAVGPGRGCGKFDTQVFVKQGVKNLKDVSIGDEVITLDGSFKKVERTFEYECSEDLLNIKCYYGDNQGAVFTSDHKIYAEKYVRVSNYENWAESTKKSKKSFEEPTGNLKWIRADQLEVGDWVFVPDVNFDVGNKQDRVDLSCFVSKSNIVEVDELSVTCEFSSNCKRFSFSRFINHDQDFFKFLGIFTGDGWFENHKKNRVSFCYHSGDLFVKTFLMYFFDKYRMDYRINKFKNKKVEKIYVSCEPFCNYLKSLFCEYKLTSCTKHVPKMVFGTSVENRMSFLKGYLHADGHVDKNKIKFTTVSKNLAYQIKMIFLSLGFPCSVNLNKRYDTRPDFKDESIEYNMICPHIEGLTFNNSNKSYFYKKINNGILLKIRDISVEKNETGKVYDIQVQDNHNFLTSSFLVHNSAVGSLVCYCLGITDIDPIQHDLLFSRFLSPARGGRSIRFRFHSNPLSA